MAEPYFTRRRRISLKKAHIVLVDKCVLFSGWGTRIQNPFCAKMQLIPLEHLAQNLQILADLRRFSYFMLIQKTKGVDKPLLLFFGWGTRIRT